MSQRSGIALALSLLALLSAGCERERDGGRVAALCARLRDPAVLSDDNRAAVMLFRELDLSRPELTDVVDCLEQRDYAGALSLWRDGVVERLREHDFGQYGWHSYVRHPRCAEAADYLCGLSTREAYLKKWKDQSPGFIDIFGMRGPPRSGRPINWFVDINSEIDWGDPAFAAWDTGRKLQRTVYVNFEFMKSFVGRYWDTGNEAYMQKAFEIMSDFARHHHDGFWRDYYQKGFHDKEVREIYRCDWRLNTNGLAMGWRLKNFLKIMAGLCKSLSSDKPKKWDDVLAPVPGPLTRQELDRIPADQLADIALCLMKQHTGKVLWFCVPDGAVPNQRAEGLKAAAFLSAIFPNFKTTPQLTEYVERAYIHMLDGNILPDGGSLEQSFNYNTQDKEGLEELVRFFGDAPPPYARLALAKVKARRAVDDGLQTPLGDLPQVGNSHAVLGKAVWEGEETSKRYWASKDIHGREPVRPRPYTSKAFPYSGFFAMRSGWGMDDLYLFLMAGRPQGGHSMRDNNSIQVTAYGRQLVVCGGPPTYGMFRNDDARGADFYLSESSSLKTNTVLVDGHSQSKNAPRAKRAYRTPVASRWHTSDRFDLVDGLYNLGYGECKKRRDVNIDMSVEHYRSVVFVKEAKLWLIQDRMINKGKKEHQYTQVWNFLPYCEDKRWAKSIAGFKEDQFRLEGDRKRFRTTDPTGPNVEFRHFGPGKIAYRKYCGHRDPWLGWLATGIGDARPAVDIHANWQSADGDVLLTLLIPLDKGRASPVKTAQLIDAANGKTRGIDATLQNGLRLRFLCSATPQRLAIGPIEVSGKQLLVVNSPSGVLSGLAVGCERLRVDGKPTPIPASDFEFVREPKGDLRLTPFFVSAVPVIAEARPFLDISHVPPVEIRGGTEDLTVRYTLDGSEPTGESLRYTGPVKLARECTVKARFFRGDTPLPLVASERFGAWQWALREPDRTSADGLERGLVWQYMEHEGWIRLYDIMHRKVVKTGRSDDLCLSPWDKAQRFGLKFDGYLHVPRAGMYHFAMKSPQGACLFIRSDERDLHVPPVVRVSYREHEGEGSIALQAGYHKLQIWYQRIQSPNTLEIEVEGPGLPRQALPADWLFRQRPE